MPKASITDSEISLIKGMLARGMKNKEIQFFFNRPDRAVNSGRISQIKQGIYGRSGVIDVCTDDELESFVAARPTPAVAGAITIPIIGRVPSETFGPVHPKTLSRMFEQDTAGNWRFAHGESDEHECKESFGFKHSGAWLRAIAALANNRGGYIFFGILDKDPSPVDGIDKSYLVCGLQDRSFQDADPADFSKRVKAALDPTPIIRIATFKIDQKVVGVIHVEQHSSRPVIVSSTIGDRLREGDIYFRYPGQSDRIKYSDLRTILDARDLAARQQMLPMVERLLSLGPSKALIADLEEGSLSDGESKIVIDEALLERIKFIREGEFDQVDGAPTLKLIGQVTQDSRAEQEAKVVRDVVGETDILRNFLQQQTVHFPESYVRQGIDLQRKWLPIFYYQKQTGVPAAELAEKISKETTLHKVKRDELVKRLRKSTSARTKKITSNALRLMVKQIEQGNLPEFTTGKEAARFSDAITCIHKTAASLPTLLAALVRAKGLVEAEDPKSVGRVCKAICRVDELFFS